jgi:hypothetical protein
VKPLVTLAIWLTCALPATAQQASLFSAAPVAAPAVGIHPAVARIVAPGDGSISYGSGTLVWVGDNHGLVVTNWHVINEATAPISVHFPDGFYSLGTVQKVDRDWDLALVAVRKPNAQPVRLADHAPRPGELLTIAGYGSGQYRAASGTCTQYVAPGTTFPFEMVEVAVSARQGDSGGPIFNSRGELAGVLFGEGHGRTSGSYCGRVKWFLSSVTPSAIVASESLARVPLKPVSARPSESSNEAEPARIVAAPATHLANQEFRPDASEARGQPASIIATAPLGGVDSASQALGWEDLAGTTLGEQAKTVLAALGVLAIILHALRWLGTEHAKS